MHLPKLFPARILPASCCCNFKAVSSFALCVGRFLQVIVLHNSFLSAALERCLLTQIEVVKLINSLLAASSELTQQAAALVDISSTGDQCDGA